MATFTAKDVVRTEVPADLDDSLILRCTDVKFGKGQKAPHNPQIRSEWEVVGIPLEDGTIADRIKRGDKEFVIAGLSTSDVYHTLSKKALGFHQDFWSLALERAKEEYEVDTENPDTSYYKGLIMSARCKANVVERRKKLSKEQKEAMVAAGLEPLGEIIIDPITKKPQQMVLCQVQSWNRKWDGEVPAF